jgi:7-cyano-7-deazaguanine synthase in queuosine biosynthesis
MTEQLFLCGLSKTQGSEYNRGRELHLHGPRTNVRLKLDDIRCRFLDVEPELSADLLEIAAYVFAADNAVSRGGPTFRNMGKYWRREFRLVIAVRQPGCWSEPQRLHALREVLQFLSGDAWAFEFLDLENPPSIQSYLSFADAHVDRSGDTTIVLFSGGLDSFAGAVHELNNSNSHVVLVSRRIPGMTEARQKELASALKGRHPGRVTHVPVIAGLKKETASKEHTQRTRSFLLAAMAMVAAVMEGSDRIRFYENGVMSVNLPISTQVVGARASRSTHPRSLMLLGQLGRLVWGDEIRIDNPFIWKTKVEVVRELHLTPEGEAIRRTLSCARTRSMTVMHPHCGTCAQCLQRRIATLGAGATDADPGDAYAIDMLVGPRQDGEDRAMAVDMVRSALEYHRFSDEEFARRFAGEFAWLTTSFAGEAPSDVARKFIEMFRRHGAAVRDILVCATEQQAAALVDRTLPDSCLLRMVHDSPDMKLDEAPIVSSRSPDLSEERRVQDEDLIERSEVVIAVDDVNKRVLIEGIAPITGSSDFRIVSVLVRLYVEDREAGRLPATYRTLSAADLAEEASSIGDTAGRQAISRLRRRISGEFEALYDMELSLDTVIENVHGKGYRINPAVRVVAPAELARR